ncbi:MAG: hypothetical protein ACN0LA_10700 [Candidatus Longimicrobiales bacterium M2_2A_002]
MAKRYYEAEFGVWVEEPDPLKKPACESAWPDGWDYDQGTRPQCFRPEGHEGEHHETRKLSGGDGVVEYYWTDEPGSGRTELGENAIDASPGTDADPSADASLEDDAF